MAGSRVLEGKIRVLTPPALALALLTGCQSLSAPAHPQATLEPRSGSSVTGSVHFIASAQGIVVAATVRGLKPNSEHGFHVHENGDCSAPDAMSAGGHFNPHGAPHGFAGSAAHAGDLPNLRADAYGTAIYKTTLAGLSLTGAQGLVGRSVVVHRDPDDHRSQPAGNSGPRVACGIIRP